MPDTVQKIIERVKGKYGKLEVINGKVMTNSRDFWILAANSIMPLITAYEESQKELEKEKYQHQVERIAHKMDNKTYNADIATLLDRLRPFAEMHDEDFEDDRIYLLVSAEAMKLAHQTFTLLSKEYENE